MRVTDTIFKKNLDQILDSVIANGASIEIVKSGRIVKLVPVPTPKKKKKN